jgi:sugar (pentulose or hexulose) kinase
MRNDIFIGVDIGTTVLKAAAFDGRSGRGLGKAGVTLTVKTGADGAREQSPMALDHAMLQVFSVLRKQLGARWRQVAGIGLAAQGGSGVIVDRERGTPFTPMYLWNDLRALLHMPQIRKAKPTAFWRKSTFRDEPGWGLGRLLWLQKTRPRLFLGENMYVGAGEYCYFRLTDLWRQDPCNALQIGCFNVAAERLDARLLDIVGLPLSWVAPLRKGHEIHPLSKVAAARLGLRAGLPVAGPYMDHEAGYLSAVDVSRHPLQCSLGTAWVGNYTVPSSARWSSPFQLVLPSLTDKGWLVVQALLTGNVTWNWALEELVDADQRKAFAQLDVIFKEELLPPEGLVALPWFNMPNPLQLQALGGGTFFGMNARTRKTELLRAVAASMVYEMARVFAEVRDKRKVDSVVLGGGASKGRVFQTLFAALFSPLPVHRVEDEDQSGARGTLYPLCRKIACSRTQRLPLPDWCLQKRIQRGFDLYRNVFDRLYGGFAGGGPIHFK